MNVNVYLFRSGIYALRPESPADEISEGKTRIKCVACNAGVFCRAIEWPSERHSGFKLGRGLGRDAVVSSGVLATFSRPTWQRINSIASLYRYNL